MQLLCFLVVCVCTSNACTSKNCDKLYSHVREDVQKISSRLTLVRLNEILRRPTIRTTRNVWILINIFSHLLVSLRLIYVSCKLWSYTNTDYQTVVHNLNKMNSSSMNDEVTATKCSCRANNHDGNRIRRMFWFKHMWCFVCLIIKKMSKQWYFY